MRQVGWRAESTRWARGVNKSRNTTVASIMMHLVAVLVQLLVLVLVSTLARATS